MIIIDLFLLPPANPTSPFFLAPQSSSTVQKPISNNPFPKFLTEKTGFATPKLRHLEEKNKHGEIYHTPQPTYESKKYIY